MKQVGAGEDLLVEAWRLMRPLWLSTRDDFFKQMADLGLTPPHGKALLTLSSGPVRMRDLADSMACDASWVTSVVDRLEELGFAERRSSADDRRVREVLLTTKGQQVADQLDAVFNTPPASLDALSEPDRKALVRVLRKLDVGVADGEFFRVGPIVR